MNREAAILVIADEHEAILVASAIALHAPRLKVRAMPGWRPAVQYLADAQAQGAAPRLIILGGGALREAAAAIPLIGASAGMPVVGLAPDVSAEARDNALAAGLQAVYERPSGWDDYSEAVRTILRRWVF
jgi:hypothetical protein